MGTDVTDGGGTLEELTAIDTLADRDAVMQLVSFPNFPLPS